ncbi:hypothetical protein CEXT_229032 [Caerostris extrusa]|uniref:Saposin n=1 Tax=Caerostris extrusa TaxID=172846 RepID=A0AAV4VDE5_CAEEX|nr:hypothetical protein CEXT_229032 [Caerostris extrusa]
MRLPAAVASECKQFVDENIDFLMNTLVEFLDPQKVCSILKICPAQIVLEAPKISVNNVECDLCKQVVNKVGDKETEEQIMLAMEKVCGDLSPSITTECEEFVSTYGDMIVALLVQHIEKELVCPKLQLCPAQIKLEAPKSSVNDVECELCKEVIAKVEDIVKDQKTVDKIEAALDEVCSRLPSSIATKCINFVNTYTDMIVTLLMQELDPAMVCAELKLCTAQIKIQKPKDVKDLKCDLCKTVVSEVEEMVKDKKTEDKIEAALDEVCSRLPSSIATKCINFVNTYTDMIVTLLMQELDPAMVCAELKLCTAKGMECQACQYALHFLQELLMGNETQEEVKNALKSFCHILPQQFSENCESFIDEYGASLLVLVAQEIDPSVMCLKMQLCPSKELIPQLKGEASEVALNHFLVDECSVCTTVVDYVDKLLEEDDVDKELTKLVEKVCTVLPASYQEKCASTLEAYGPYILQMIGQMASSKEVCQEIDLCPRTRGQVHLIGGSKCTFGPSYWCHSAAHAAACKAEMYCKTKVWEN